MSNEEYKALEITTELVKVKLSNSSNAVNSNGGKALVDYFKTIYKGILGITTDCFKSE